MKKWIFLLAMLLCFAGCGSESADRGGKDKEYEEDRDSSKGNGKTSLSKKDKQKSHPIDQYNAYEISGIWYGKKDWELHVENYGMYEFPNVASMVLTNGAVNISIFLDEAGNINENSYYQQLMDGTITETTVTFTEGGIVIDGVYGMDFDEMLFTRDGMYFVDEAAGTPYDEGEWGEWDDEWEDDYYSDAPLCEFEGTYTDALYDMNENAWVIGNMKNAPFVLTGLEYFEINEDEVIMMVKVLNTSDKPYFGMFTVDFCNEYGTFDSDDTQFLFTMYHRDADAFNKDIELGLTEEEYKNNYRVGIPANKEGYLVFVDNDNSILQFSWDEIEEIAMDDIYYIYVNEYGSRAVTPAEEEATFSF